VDILIRYRPNKFTAMSFDYLESLSIAKSKNLPMEDQARLIVRSYSRLLVVPCQSFLFLFLQFGTDAYACLPLVWILSVLDCLRISVLAVGQGRGYIYIYSANSIDCPNRNTLFGSTALLMVVRRS
jgi:hypothetical protein